MGLVLSTTNKKYYCQVYKNYNDISFFKDKEFLTMSDLGYVSYVDLSNKGDYNEIYSLGGYGNTEELYVKNYSNPLASILLRSESIFIDETEDKISLKYKTYVRNRRLGKKFFRVRKVTRFLTFSFKNKMFYFGEITSKSKKNISKKFRVNPTPSSISFFVSEITQYSDNVYNSNIVDNENLNIFLKKIWDRLNIKNEFNFKYNNDIEFYYLTYCKVNNIKLPNEWGKFMSFFVSKDLLKKSNMNIVDSTMSLLGLKGNKVRKLFNTTSKLRIDLLYNLYHLLGIDKFNCLPDEIFIDKNDENIIYSPINDYIYPKIEDIKKLGELLNNVEKDNIVKLSVHKHIDIGFIKTLYDHIDYKKKLHELGEKVSLKFKNIVEFNDEHYEFSLLLDSYTKGDIERFYGDIGSVEEPIYVGRDIFYPVLLRTNRDFNEESQQQKNCVRSYINRPGSIIFSIRKGSNKGEERTTVEYGYKDDHLTNIQERGKYNTSPDKQFSNAVFILLSKLNYLYKMNILKLPKIVKKFKNGEIIESQSAFRKVVNGNNVIINRNPTWDNDLIVSNEHIYEYEILPF